MNEKFLLYVAHPISGLSYDEVFGYYEKVRADLGFYYDVLSPMTGKEELRNEIEFRAQGYDNPVATNRAIVGRDKWMVEKCDILFVNLNSATSRVSIGAMCEMAWAYQRGKHIILVMNKNQENIHNHAFVLEMADIHFDAYQDAIDYLVDLSNG